MAEQIKTTGSEVLAQYINPGDFDDCGKTGVYRCLGLSASNAPTSHPYGTLVVFQCSSDSSYTVQLFITRSNPVKLYIRLRTYPWVEVV